jgi:DNA-binding beta-propeller fold protein YncE
MAADQAPPSGECCSAAPPVLEFDQEGNLVQGWGAPGPGYEWPTSEHGIFVDDEDHVWIGSNSGVGTDTGSHDTHILKFTRAGEFLLQIGKKNVSDGNLDTENMKHPAALAVDTEANEVYVADGEWGGAHRGNIYGNQRVIVFDATSGAFKRMWGAYGNPPEDVPLANYDPAKPDDNPQFRGPHGIRLSKDGLVYVADRGTNRVQVFRRDGTFVKERIISPSTLYPGMASDVAFSADPDERFVYVADGMNKKVWVLDRESLATVDKWGHGGHWGGMFNMPHSIAVDGLGNVYVTETLVGRRVQRFAYQGMGAPVFDVASE